MRIPGKARVIVGDMREALAKVKENSADAIVTDPPYGLSFMGKDWDRGVPGLNFWLECLRVLKPGGHMLAFGGTRTHHRLWCAIEDAGFEIRDCIMWIFGTGFPKSLDVSRAIDKAAGEERPVVRTSPSGGYKRLMVTNKEANFRPEDYYPEGNKFRSNEPITDAAREWDGWGTALKPAVEYIVLARKPLDGTIVQNVLRHGVGGLNIDACRIGVSTVDREAVKNSTQGAGQQIDMKAAHPGGQRVEYAPQGRWPANLIHDGSDEAVEGFASAARYFYCAKASRAEREEGLEALESVTGAEAVGREEGAAGTKSPRAGAGRTRAQLRNDHPTVKPLALMRYLVRLITPPDGVVLDPFCGSGSTLVAAIQEGMRPVGIDIDEKYCQIAWERVLHAIKEADSLT